MKKFLVVCAALAVMSLSVKAEGNIKWYGFIRNYLAFDSRECWAGTADLFTYLPKDISLNANVDDINANPNFSYSAITSRLGVNVNGYEFEGLKIGAKIEADFYSGLSGVTGTATFRLRQAYLTLSRSEGSNPYTIKIGQTWHPMAADMPDVFALNTGAPFGPFNRSPLIQIDEKLVGGLSYNAALIWQMQYTSAGPDGASANYMKYLMIPELYVGLSYQANGFTARLGTDQLVIAPRIYNADKSKKLKERSRTALGFVYLAYAKDLFSVKFKTTFGEGGEHLTMNTGYAATLDSITEAAREYTGYNHSSSWLSLRYGKKVQGVLFAGYFKNFGTDKAVDPDAIYYYKNSSVKISQAYRITPAIVYNLGKLAIGLEYEYTAAQYGKGLTPNQKGLYTEDLHWVGNNRVQAMFKYTF